MKQFSSLGEFADFFAGAVERAELAAQAELTQSATLIEALSKAKLGEEQSYWLALSPFTIAYKVKHGFPVPSPLYRTGEHIHDTIEKTVAPTEADIGSNDEVAFWQELGTSKIPPRSFLASTLRENEENIVRLVATGYIRALSGIR